MSFLDDPGLRHLWGKIKGALAKKQDALTGCIVMWSGSREDIPAGWALCFIMKL